MINNLIKLAGNRIYQPKGFLRRKYFKSSTEIYSWGCFILKRSERERFETKEKEIRGKGLKLSIKWGLKGSKVLPFRLGSEIERRSLPASKDRILRSK